MEQCEWECVEVVNRQTAFVLLNEDKRRAVDDGRVDSQSLGRRLNEPRFSGSEITDERHDETRQRGLAKRSGETPCRVFGFAVDFERRV